MVLPLGRICISVASAALVASGLLLYRHSTGGKVPIIPDAPATGCMITANCDTQVLTDSVLATGPDIDNDLELYNDGVDDMSDVDPGMGSFEIVNERDASSDEDTLEYGIWNPSFNVSDIPQVRYIDGWVHVSGVGPEGFSSIISNDSDTSVIPIVDNNRSVYIQHADNIQAMTNSDTSHSLNPTTIGPTQPETYNRELAHNVTSTTLGMMPPGRTIIDTVTDSTVESSPADTLQASVTEGEPMFNDTATDSQDSLDEIILLPSPARFRGSLSQSTETLTPVATPLPTCMSSVHLYQTDDSSQGSIASDQNLTDSESVTQHTPDGSLYGSFQGFDMFPAPPTYEDAMMMARVEPSTYSPYPTFETKVRKFGIGLSELRFVAESILRMHADELNNQRSSLKHVLHRASAVLSELESEFCLAVGIPRPS